MTAFGSPRRSSSGHVGAGIFGLYELEQELSLHLLRLDNRVGTAMRRTVLQGSKLAAQASRKDTHATEASILASPETERTAEGWHGEWYSSTDYDPYQEYGTSNGISPNWHHRRAFEEVAPRFEEALAVIAGLD